MIRGRPSYIRWTLFQWISGFRDILVSEYGLEIDVVMVDGYEENPLMVINSVVIDRYVFDEGYVFEIIKKALDKVCRRVGDSL